MRAASTGSGGNLDNATRQNFRRLLENGTNWTPDEEAQLNQIVRGTPIQNAMRLAGKLSPSGNGLIPQALARALMVTGIGNQRPAGAARSGAWSELTTGERFALLRKLSGATWLNHDERQTLAEISDKFCLTPAKISHSYVTDFMDILMRRLARSGEIKETRS